MAAGRAAAARRPLHRGRRAEADEAVEHRQARCTSPRATSTAGFERGRRGRSSGRYTTKPVHQAYIEPHACVVSVGADGQTHDLELEPGPVHGARLYCAKLLGVDIANIRAIAGRDRRRLRRQDAGLPRAAGARAVEEVRPAGQDADEPRGGVPRHRPDLRRRRSRSSSAPRRTAPSSRPKHVAEVPGRRLPRLAGPAGLHVRLRDVRHPERRRHRLRRGEQPAEGRGLPRARRADRVVRGGKLRSTSWRAKLGIDPLELREMNARQGRHQDGARADLDQYRLSSQTLEAAKRQRALEDRR